MRVFKNRMQSISEQANQIVTIQSGVNFSPIIENDF